MEQWSSTVRKVKEMTHAIVRPLFGGSFSEQLQAVNNGISALGVRPALVRYFLSDVVNQARQVAECAPNCPVSLVGQPALSGEKVVAWVWINEFNEPAMFFQTGSFAPGNPRKATADMFLELNRELKKHGCSVNNDCVRTWLYVNEVDRDYGQVVCGRNDAFRKLRLHSHFIASTGIEAKLWDITKPIMMESVSYLGLDSGQVKYLTAPKWLNPTMEYGVAFERATALELPGRREVFVSGTASIDSNGQVVHSGDVVAQAQRMLQNVQALLAEAEMTLDDAMHFVVYLRDISDFQAIDELFEARYPQIPRVVVRASVCRPQWLIEMECMAVK